jgi:hypothetical protein
MKPVPFLTEEFVMTSNVKIAIACCVIGLGAGVLAGCGSNAALGDKMGMPGHMDSTKMGDSMMGSEKMSGGQMSGDKMGANKMGDKMSDGKMGMDSPMNDSMEPMKMGTDKMGSN